MKLPPIEVTIQAYIDRLKTSSSKLSKLRSTQPHQEAKIRALTKEVEFCESAIQTLRQHLASDASKPTTPLYRAEAIQDSLSEEASRA